MCYLVPFSSFVFKMSGCCTDTSLVFTPENLISVISFALVTCFFQNIFPTTYERHKLVAKDELRQSKWDVELTPRLVSEFL